MTVKHPLLRMASRLVAAGLCLSLATGPAQAQFFLGNIGSTGSATTTTTTTGATGATGGLGGTGTGVGAGGVGGNAADNGVAVFERQQRARRRQAALGRRAVCG